MGLPEGWNRSLNLKDLFNPSGENTEGGRAFGEVQAKNLNFKQTSSKSGSKTPTSVCRSLRVRPAFGATDCAPGRLLLGECRAQRLSLADLQMFLHF